MIAVLATKAMKPYMVKRCEILRLVFENSADVSTSLVKTFAAIETFSPPLTVRVQQLWLSLHYQKSIWRFSYESCPAQCRPQPKETLI